MDLNNIIAKVAENARHQIKMFGRHQIDIIPGDTQSERINNFIQGKVWAALLETIKMEDERVFNPAEVGATLIHKGVCREDVRFASNRYLFQLKHYLFAIKRSTLGKISAGPFPSKNGCLYREVTDKDPAALAEAMLYFDSLAQEMERLASEIMDTLKGQALEDEKEKMIKSVAESTLAVLIDKYITPLGLRNSYVVTVEGGRPQVKLGLRLQKAVVIDVPLDELAEKLKDSGALLDSMKVVSEEEFEKVRLLTEMERLRRLDDIYKEIWR